MLELGIRLSSKKPTLVIAEEGCDIPFDIKDFEALPYPAHLSMLRMEDFLSRLSDQIREKYAAYQGQTYKPFLADVATLDVLEPQARAVPFETLVVSQLSEVVDRIAQLESQSRRGAYAPMEIDISKEPLQTTYLVLPADRASKALALLRATNGLHKISRYSEREGEVAFALTYSALRDPSIGKRLTMIAGMVGGRRELPAKFRDIEASQI